MEQTTRWNSYDTPPPPAPRDDPARAPWGPAEILGALLVAALALLLMSFTIGGVLQLLDVPSGAAEDDPAGATVLLLGQMFLNLVVVGAAAALSIGRHRLTFRAWGLRTRQPVNWGACFAVLFASFVTLTAYGWLTQVLGWDRLRPESNVPESLFDQPSVLPLTIFMVVIVAPFTEEMFFRGFLFNGLRRLLTTPGAALLSGAMFGAIHVTQASLVGVAIPFTIIGFLFAMLMARTGSLWNAIVVHLVFNLIGVVATLATGTVLI